MGVDDRLHRGERRGGEPAADLDVPVGALADAQPAGVVQSGVSGLLVLGGVGGPADLVGGLAGLADVVASPGPVEQSLLATRIGLRGVGDRLGFVGGDLPGQERVLVSGQVSSRRVVSSARLA